MLENNASLSSDAADDAWVREFFGFEEPKECVTVLSVALDCAKRGWRVFPCHHVIDGKCSCGNAACASIGKHPRTANGCKDATVDATVIESCWQRWPDANIGIACGPASGVWVLDLDGPEGIAAFENLQAEHGAVPATYSVATGGGGRHLYFKYPENCKVGNRAKINGLPIDARGDGGYVIAPPSIHRSGTAYSVEADLPIAEAPYWLLDLVLRKPRESASTNGYAAPTSTADGEIERRAVAYLDAMPEAISGSGGHAATYAAAVALVHGFCLSQERSLALLLANYNPRCQPEWTCKELRHKIEDAATKQHDNPYGWLRDGEVDCGDIDMDWIERMVRKPSAAIDQFQPFPVDALPEPAREFVLAAAETIGVDPGFVALPVLSVLAGAIGNSRRLVLNSTWSVPAGLWGIVIGESGTQKSPAFSLATTPITRIQQNKIKEYETAMTDYHRESKVYKRDLARWEKSGEGLPPIEPDLPSCPRCLIRDTTIEALMQTLHRNPRGVLVARDELAGLVESFNQYRNGKGGDVATWIEFYDGGAAMVDRKSNGGVLCVPRALVSICGGIQPGTFRRVLSRQFVENGMVARFLLAMPPRSAKRWTDRDVPPSIALAYEKLVGDLLDLPMGTSEAGEPVPVNVVLAEPASEIWKEFVNSWGERQLQHVGAEAALLSKLEGTAARFALIHHVASDAGDACSAVGVASIEAGIKLAHWFAAEGLRIYRSLGAAAGDVDQGGILERIKRCGGAMSARELLRSRLVQNGDEAIYVLDELVQAGFGNWQETPTGPRGGRPTRVFHLTCDETDKTSPRHNAF